MARYYFNQKRTKDLQEAIKNAPDKFEVWFQPQHHHGCCQVICFENEAKTKAGYCVNTFKSRDIGHETYCEKLRVDQNDCLQLSEHWIDLVLRAKTIKFHTNIRQGKVVIRMEAITKK